METIYGIIVKRPKKEIYGFPMILEQIDRLFCENSLEDLLNKIKESNIIPDFDPRFCEISIGINQNNKWVERKTVPLILDSFVLNYSLETIFKNSADSSIYCSCLYGKLAYLLKKTYPSLELKNAILKLQESSYDFLLAYKELSYVDQRFIKYIFAKEFDVQKIYQKIEGVYLKRTILEEKKSA